MMFAIPPVSPDYFLPDRFKGKTLLITGAATGIGAATAIRAAREGANLVCVDRKEQELHATVNLIRNEQHQAIAIVADVTQTPAANRMVQEAVRAFGGLDLAVNAAGVIDGCDPAQPCDFEHNRNLLPALIHEATDEYWDIVIANNTTSCFKSLRAELQQMVKQGQGGAIVNIGSIAGITGLNGMPAYVASKHGVNGLTKNAALDYASYGIRVNSVNMSETATPMVARAYEFVKWKMASDMVGMPANAKLRSALQANDPDNRAATPWEQAATILYLLSDEASNLTGGIFATDGGWTAY